MLVLKHVAVGEVALFMRGNGALELPTLLVLHGGPGWDHSYLLPALDDLADVRRVVLLDLRGCGRSSRDLPGDAYQPDHCVADAAGVVAALGLSRVDVLGFSYGGQLAMLLAERHPDLVDRLVLASTTAYPDVEDDLGRIAEYRRREPAVSAGVAAALADPALDDAGKTRAMAMAAAPMNVWDLGLLDDWRAVLGRVRFSGDWNAPWLAGRLRPPRPRDPERVLRELGRRVLVLHGEHDLGFPVAVARRLHAAVPGSRLVVVPGAGHAAHFERRAEWVGAVRGFLTAGG
ncbi:alpha/beta fold hydrolase [Pseudonocardia lacus]|uniref:alpha/beta fold hydrolase n=1 Tax=Pseudonocardia lacus TaxID=2835865 RepID=UPI001BDDC2EB|nr:alpha/beta hydrolase [Pseudonocardia lacus]